MKCSPQVWGEVQARGSNPAAMRAQFNACSFGRMGSNSRQSSDGSDGGGAGAHQRPDARAEPAGAAGPAFFGASGIHGLDAAALGSGLGLGLGGAGGVHGRAIGAALGGGAHGGGPRLGLAALRFLVRAPKP